MNSKAFYKLSYGLYVICSKKGDKFNGQIANTVFQITSEPPTIAVSINKSNLTNEFIRDSKVLTVSMIAQEAPLSFIGHFGFKSGREMDKLADINYITGETGVPIITDNTIAYLEVQITQQVDVGTHDIFIGDVINADVLKESEPMTYAYYHLVKRGSTPKTAPSYVEEKKEVKKMDRYVCTVCGYVYDPEQGDPDGGIQPGTAFEALPDDWVCPVCGATKSEFEKEA